MAINKIILVHILLKLSYHSISAWLTPLFFAGFQIPDGDSYDLFCFDAQLLQKSSEQPAAPQATTQTTEGCYIICYDMMYLEA